MSYRVLPIVPVLLLAGSFAACDAGLPASPDAMLDEVAALGQRGNSDATPAAANRALAQLRRVTARYQRLEAALDPDLGGYVLPEDECVPGMGVHYVKPSVMFDGTYDPATPEVLVYDVDEHGARQLVAVEFVIFRAEWAPGDASPPTFLGHEFDRSFGADSHGLPDHYEIHIWIWKANPNGMFAPLNPKVVCPA